MALKRGGMVLKYIDIEYGSSDVAVTIQFVERGWLSMSEVMTWLMECCIVIVDVIDRAVQRKVETGSSIQFVCYCF